jgi:DnaK suppressor protein
MNIEEQKAAVEAELTKVTEELEAIATLEPRTGEWMAVPDPSEIGNPDENEEADVIEGWNERRALAAQLETNYRNLLKTKAKLAAGTYGQCEICAGQIEAARLEANLTARTCLAHLENEPELPL